MEVNQLAKLLEDKKTWKEAQLYTKQLKAQNVEIIQNLLENLDAIINGKQFKPYARLGAVYLLKLCMEVCFEYFTLSIQEGDFLDKLAQYARSKKPTQILFQNPDKEQETISNTFYVCIVESFYMWAQWFPYDLLEETQPSKFVQLFNQLKKEGVKFSEKLQIYKPEDKTKIVNGKLQKDEKKAAEESKKNEQEKKDEQKSVTAQPTQQPITKGGVQNDQQTKEIQIKLNEHQNIKNLLIELLQYGNDQNYDQDMLQIYEMQINEFQQYTDKVMAEVDLDDVLMEKLIDESDICLQILQAFESFNQQKIHFQDLRNEIFKILKQQQQQQNKSQQNSQQQLDQSQRQQQQNNKLKELEEQQRLKQIQEDQERQKKLHEEQEKQKKLQEEQEKQKKIQEEQERQRKLQEEQDNKKKLEEQEKQKKQKEEQEKQKKLQEEQEKQLKLQQEQEKQKQAQEQEKQKQALEQEKQRKVQEEQEKQKKLKEEQEKEKQKKQIEEQERQKQLQEEQDKQKKIQEEKEKKQKEEQRRKEEEEQEKQRRIQQEEQEKIKRQQAEQKKQQQLEVERALKEQKQKYEEEQRMKYQEHSKYFQEEEISKQQKTEPVQSSMNLNYQQKRGQSYVNFDEESQRNLNEIQKKNQKFDENSEEKKSFLEGFEQVNFQSQQQQQIPKKKIFGNEQNQQSQYMKSSSYKPPQAPQQAPLNVSQLGNKQADMEQIKLQLENNKQAIKIRELELELNEKIQESLQNDKQLKNDKHTLEKRLREKEQQLFAMKQTNDQLNKEIDQYRSIVKQYEQAKVEQMYIIQEKKTQMERENEKTKQQLEDYINKTQKAHLQQLENIQKQNVQLQNEILRLQQETIEKEVRTTELENELKLRKNQEKGFSTQLLKEKDSKFADLKSKFDVIQEQMKQREGKINELIQVNFELQKINDNLAAKNHSGNETVLLNENLIQKEIQINQLKQILFEKDQEINRQEQVINQYEKKGAGASEIVENMKKNYQNQMNKYQEQLQEMQNVIQVLQKDNKDLENRQEVLNYQYKNELDRVFAVGNLSENEIQELKNLKNDNEKLLLKIQDLLYEKKELEKEIFYLKKQNDSNLKNFEKYSQIQEELILQNNLLTKKLQEKDSEILKEKSFFQKDKELKEKSLNNELVFANQALETFKKEQQRKEAEMSRNLELLKKENMLLLSTLKTKAVLSPEKPFSQQQSNLQENYLQYRYSPEKSTNYLENNFLSPLKQIPELTQKFAKYSPENYQFGNLSALNNNNNQNLLYRFKKACLKNKMVIYQDDNLNIGIISEQKEIEDKIYLLLKVFFENKSLNTPLSNVQIDYFGDNTIQVYKKPNTMASKFEPNQQYQQELIVEYMQFPYKILQAQIKYNCGQNTNIANVFLPNSINKYLSPIQNIQIAQINNVFNTMNIISSEEISVDKNIASSQYDYANYFPNFINMGNSDNYPQFQCMGGQYFLKNTQTNFWIKINYNKKDHKAIFQIAYENTPLNPSAYILQTLMMIFKEQ